MEESEAKFPTRATKDSSSSSDPDFVREKVLVLMNDVVSSVEKILFLETQVQKKREVTRNKITKLISVRNIVFYTYCMKVYSLVLHVLLSYLYLYIYCLLLTFSCSRPAKEKSLLTSAQYSWTSCKLTSFYLSDYDCSNFFRVNTVT